MPDGIDIVRATFEPSSPALAAFDYLLAHARAAAFVLVPRLSDVRSMEFQWPDRRRNPFSAQAHPRHVNFYLRSPILTKYPGLFQAASDRFGPVKRNRLGEYRTHLQTVEEAEAMLDFLRANRAWPADRTDRRFTAASFAPLTAVHFLDAAERLAAGLRDHGFGPSTDYDLLFNGHRLPPKAVFGLAATGALGFPVGPANFSAGEGTLCFRLLREAGYEIVAKGEPAKLGDPLVDDEDRIWTEGRQRFVAHLSRERGTGMAAAKRAQFRSIHGKLLCERCGMDPAAQFGSEIGEACIEVHHRETQVGDMAPGHRTSLADLECLCANCHRVTHRELKLMADPATDRG